MPLLKLLSPFLRTKESTQSLLAQATPAPQEYRRASLAAGFAFGSENYLSQMLESLLGIAKFRF
ncbi:hypothetical protein BB029_26750 [Pseudomonas sp. S3E12]|nr:hypothetical protein BB029_26750 [Pseudomonas sp. S3E12]